jgi:hypothetical protein
MCPASVSSCMSSCVARFWRVIWPVSAMSSGPLAAEKQAASGPVAVSQRHSTRAAGGRTHPRVDGEGWLFPVAM